MRTKIKHMHVLHITNTFLSGDICTHSSGIHNLPPTQNFDIWQLYPRQIHSATVSFSLFSLFLHPLFSDNPPPHPPPPPSTLLSLPSFSSPPFSLLHPFSPFPLTEHHHRPHLTSTVNIPKLTTTAGQLLFRRR